MKDRNISITEAGERSRAAGYVVKLEVEAEGETWSILLKETEYQGLKISLEQLETKRRDQETAELEQKTSLYWPFGMLTPALVVDVNADMIRFRGNVKQCEDWIEISRQKLSTTEYDVVPDQNEISRLEWEAKRGPEK